MNIIILAIFILKLFQYGCTYNLNFKFYNHPDVDLSTKQIVNKYGYPFEVHKLVTKDNYMLTTFRIPHGRNTNTTNKHPVLLVHGTAGCADNFIAIGAYNALAYYLADRGYDVWLMNARGSVYSRKHKYLNPDLHAEFWQFGWHEIGAIDTPDNIDYILKVTNQSKLFYIGHSQGTTTYFVMSSVRPEYNDKIKVAVQLAPSLYLGYVKYPITKFISRLSFVIHDILKFFGIHELFPQNTRVISVFRFLCSEITVLGSVCRQALYFGQYSSFLNKRVLQIIFRTSPAGLAIRQLIHYFQMVDTGVFKQFDFGLNDNLRIYKNATPPEYNLKLSTAPVAFFYSTNDFVSPPEQITALSKVLPNIYYKHAINFTESFNHVDFIFANDAATIINEPIINLFKRINKE